MFSLPSTVFEKKIKSGKVVVTVSVEARTLENNELTETETIEYLKHKKNVLTFYCLRRLKLVKRGGKTDVQAEYVVPDSDSRSFDYTRKVYEREVESMKKIMEKDVRTLVAIFYK